MIDRVEDGCFEINEKEQIFVESLVESLTNPEEAKENFREIRKTIVDYGFEDLMSGLLQLCVEIEERTDLSDYKEKVEKYARELTVLLDLKPLCSEACESLKNYRFFGVFLAEEIKEVKVVELPLILNPSVVQLLETLKNEIENPSIGLEDFCRKTEEKNFAKTFSSSIDCDYIDVFVGEIQFPEPTYDSWQKKIQAIKEKYSIEIANSEIDSFIKNEKTKFFKLVERYVKVSSLERSQNYFCYALKKFLLFSHEVVGWNRLIRKINEDLTFEVNTNFCFGSSSYFYLNIIYKSVPITPFIFYNNYYYANFHDILNYTLKLEPARENWRLVLKAIAEGCTLFVQDKEQEFIEIYIIKQLNELKSYLENIDSADFRKLREMASRNMRTGCLSEDFRNLEGQEVEEFSCFPEDCAFLYKTTKITNSTQFLIRISQLIQLSNYSTDLISYILKINQVLEPEIIQKYSCYGEVIFELKKEIADIERLVMVKKNLIVPHEENIRQIRSEFLEFKERNAAEISYRKEHPFLEKLEAAYRSKRLDSLKIKKRLDSFSKFRYLLNKNLTIAKEGIKQFEKYNTEQFEKGSSLQR